MDQTAEVDASPRQASLALSHKWLSQDELRALSRRDNVAGAAQVAGHLGLMAFLGAVNLAFLPYGASPTRSNDAWPEFGIWLAAVVAQAFVMSFLFHGEHELVHQTVFDGRDWAWLNKAFANVYGFLCFRPPVHYRCLHFNHHRFTGDPARDPELQESLIDMKLDALWKYAAYMTGVPFWIERLTTVARHGVLEMVVPREGAFLTGYTRRQMLREAWRYTLAYVVVIGAACALWPAAPWFYDAVVWAWLVPVFAGQPFLRFYILAEHIGCAAGADMTRNTRTTSAPAWYRWLAWQMPFHVEHHTFPTVPFHRLPELHRRLAANGAFAAETCDPSGAGGYLQLHADFLRRIAKAPPATT